MDRKSTLLAALSPLAALAMAVVLMVCASIHAQESEQPLVRVISSDDPPRPLQDATLPPPTQTPSSTPVVVEPAAVPCAERPPHDPFLVGPGVSGNPPPV